MSANKQRWLSHPPSNSKNSTRSRHPSPQLLPAKCPEFTCRGLICSIITIWRLYPTMKCWARRSCLIPSKWGDERGGCCSSAGAFHVSLTDGKRNAKEKHFDMKMLGNAPWNLYNAAKSELHPASFKSFRWNADANSWWTFFYITNPPTRSIDSLFLFFMVLFLIHVPIRVTMLG